MKLSVALTMITRHNFKLDFQLDYDIICRGEKLEQVSRRQCACIKMFHGLALSSLLSMEGILFYGNWYYY